MSRLSLFDAGPDDEEDAGPAGPPFLTVAELTGKVKSTLERKFGEVALKAEVSNPRTRARLLKEARLTGALEHPHIIPVHIIARTAEGEPLLVMKRIEGISWRHFIEAPDERADAFAGETALEKLLEVLMQVAKAVHYAHTRGVVHRDLKPENVMIGRFGEVYLLDWGIAVRLDEGEVREEQVAGTPGYLAPEMAGGASHPITPRTDVYLLGAVLHELLTGEPPHQAPTMQAALFKAWRSQPAVYGPDIPADLACTFDSTLGSAALPGAKVGCTYKEATNYDPTANLEAGFKDPRRCIFQTNPIYPVRRCAAAWCGSL